MSEQPLGGIHKFNPWPVYFESIFTDLAVHYASKKNEYDGAACEDDVVDSGSMFGRQFSEVNAFGLSSGSVDYTSIGARDTRMSRVSALLLEVISIDLAPLSADRSAISSIPLAAVSMSSRGPFSVI